MKGMGYQGRVMRVAVGAEKGDMMQKNQMGGGEQRKKKGTCKSCERKGRGW